MPFLFIVVGLTMIISAVQGTQAQLLSLLKGDVTGKNNYIYWSVAILLIGSIGYIQALKPLSRAFLVLIVVVLIIDSNGLFTKFTAALNTTQSTTTSGLASSVSNSVQSSASQFV